MGDFNISFGKGKESASVNENELKGGIKKEGLANEKSKSIFDAFDDGNKILDQKEINFIKEKIKQFAGEDSDKNNLSKKEAKHLIKDLGLKVNVKELFNFIVYLKDASESIKTCTTDETSGDICIEYDDDIELKEKFDKQGNLISRSQKTKYDNHLGVLTIFNNGKVEFSYKIESSMKLGDASFDFNQDITYQFSSIEEYNNNRPSKKITNTKGDEHVEEYTYHSNGKFASVKKSHNGKTSEENKYDERGNVLENKQYNAEGELISRTEKTWNDNNKQVSEKVYDIDNKLKEESVFDDNGVIKEKTTYSDTRFDTGEYSKVVAKYNNGKISNEEFLRSDGTLFRKNEYDAEGNLAKQTEYYPDGVHKRCEIVFDGDTISTTVYKIDGTIESKTSNLPDGYIGSSRQVGQGDCYLMAAINGIRQTHSGQKLLSNLIKKNGSSYTVTLPGAEKAAKGLLTDRRINKNKMYITGTYTFSATEVQDIIRQAGDRYSEGDPDVMLLEAAFEKYRMEVLKTRRANNITDDCYGIAGLQTGGSTDNILEGGYAMDAIYILTGERSESYYNPDQKNTLSTHELQDYDNNIKAQYYSAQSEIKSETQSKDQLQNMLNRIMNDNKDGHIDCIATCSFLTNDDGNIGSHALTIKSVTKDDVIIINPWEPDKTITMSRREFIEKVSAVTLATLPYNPDSNDGGGGDAPVNPNPVDPQEPEPNPVNPPAPGPNPVNPTPEPNPNNPADGDITIVKTVKIKDRQGYTALIKEELQAQGITNPTSEQITKAKRQFEAANPKTKGSQAYVHIWNQSSKPEWKGNRYLIAGETYKVPKFDV